jgi:hypothetical protein
MPEPAVRSLRLSNLDVTMSVISNKSVRYVKQAILSLVILLRMIVEHTEHGRISELLADAVFFSPWRPMIARRSQAGQFR